MNIGPSFGKTAVVLFCLLLVSASCTKKQHSNATISFNFQSKAQGALSSNIETIVLNISHMDGRLEYVDQKECDVDNCSSISAEIMTNTDWLVQLLVLTNDQTETTVINYGDQVINVSRSGEQKSINVVEKARFDRESQILGRYIPSAGHPLAGKYLTGDLVLSVFVGAGKPDMKIMKKEIFAGWFETFALDGLPFKYHFTGHDEAGVFYQKALIFNDLYSVGGLELSSPGIQANGRQVVHFTSDITTYDRRGGGLYAQRPFTNKILGFFGQNVGANRLCAEDTVNPAMSFDGEEGRSEICTSVNSDKTQCLSHASWADITVSAVALNGTADSCSGIAGNLLNVDLDDIGDGGASDIMSVYGPFTEDEDNGVEDIMSIDAASGLVLWQLVENIYLPGGVEVFVRPDNVDFDSDSVSDNMDGIRCERLVEQGFESRGIVPGASGNLALGATWFSEHPNPVIALCPLKPNGIDYFHTAILENDFDMSYAAEPLVEFQVLDDSGNIISGWDFDSSNWDEEKVEVVLPPVQASTSDLAAYIEIKNLSASESVLLNDIHLRYHYGDFYFDDDPGSGSLVFGLFGCGSLGANYLLGPGASCLVKVVTAGSTISINGVTFHSHVDVNAEISGDPDTNVQQSFGVVGGSYYTITRGTTTGFNLQFHAPPGENDYKYVKFQNNLTPWSLSGFVPGFWDRIEYKPISSGCSHPVTIGAFGSCIYLFKFHHSSTDTITEGQSNDGGTLAPPNGSGLFFSATYHFEVPVFTEPATGFVEDDIFDFGNVSSGDSYNFILDYSAGSGVTSWGSPYGLEDGWAVGTYGANDDPVCDWPTSGTGSAGNCDFSIYIPYNMPADVGSGAKKQWLTLPYDINDTFRAVDLEVRIFHL